jgi:squamous cell carcinoma antigen recognized by T-cells 3
MSEVPRQTTRTDFTGTSLPLELQQQAKELSEYLQGNSSAYQSHVALINLLHQAFVDHVYPPASPNNRGDPRTYDLLPDLRQAREKMSKLFAVGEDLWADWIQDESMLAQSIEEQVEVMEKCRQAVGEEYASTKLWTMCGDWVLHCYKSAHEAGGALSEADQMVGRELFTWNQVLDTWREAAQQTTHRLNDSHLIWDRYIQLLIDDLRRTQSPEMQKTVGDMFQVRLMTPHANWDGTFSLFSTFVTEHYPQKYEDIMAATNQDAQLSKKQWSDREEMEFKLQAAQQADDKTAEYLAFYEYIQWEQNPEKVRKKSYELINMLYERAELRFSSTPEIWEEHYLWLIDDGRQNLPASLPLQLLDRATRHCPWSGSLWSEYLIQSESQGQSIEQTQEIKNKATNTGLLDVGGMEEVLKFHKIWCSYLRRRAFRAGATDEDLDVAEMGIRSSIETVQELATKQSRSQNFDPLFRLERLYIGFLSKKGSWDSAREVWRGMVKNHGDSSEFWLRYYTWELVCYSTFVNNGRIGPDGLLRETEAPQYATALLKDALKNPNLDLPEKIMQTYLAHCEDHEDVEALQLAIVEVKRLERTVVEKRENERIAKAMAEAQAAHLKEEAKEVAEAVAVDQAKSKRKREDVDEEPNKRSRTDTEQPLVESKELDRDRENATVLVQRLPSDATETSVRKFFRDCGTINNLKILKEKGVVAIIEFDEAAAAQFALSRDGRDFHGSDISVELGKGSVLYVANYPPTADEAFIRSLFDEFGTIIDVRFPSLIHNTHRRFCYVQFELAAQAKAAEELDGTQIEGGKGKLLAKISDPFRKQDRSGPMEEGREIYIYNFPWNMDESGLRTTFKEYGTVQSIRIPRDTTGRNRGKAWMVFTTKEEAQAALKMNGSELRGRSLHVEPSARAGVKRQATTIFSRVERSKSPSAVASPAAESVASVDDVQITHGDRHERTLALMDVPHTVNDARIRALAEKYGKLVKLSLRPDHQGAVIEYVDSHDAAKASLSIEGLEIDPGRKLRVGTVPEMLKQRAETVSDKIAVGKPKENCTKPATNGSLQPAPVRRPGQPIRGRGGLGQKRGLRFKPAPSANDGEVPQKGGKSQDDFRAMLEKKENE